MANNHEKNMENRLNLLTPYADKGRDELKTMLNTLMENGLTIKYEKKNYVFYSGENPIGKILFRPDTIDIYIKNDRDNTWRIYRQHLNNNNNNNAEANVIIEGGRRKRRSTKRTKHNNRRSHKNRK